MAHLGNSDIKIRRVITAPVITQNLVSACVQTVDRVVMLVVVAQRVRSAILVGVECDFFVKNGVGRRNAHNHKVIRECSVVHFHL